MQDLHVLSFENEMEMAHGRVGLRVAQICTWMRNGDEIKGHEALLYGCPWLVAPEVAEKTRNVGLRCLPPSLHYSRLVRPRKSTELYVHVVFFRLSFSWYVQCSWQTSYVLEKSNTKRARRTCLLICFVTPSLGLSVFIINIRDWL